MNITKQYWPMKSEPSEYSIDDLARDKQVLWYRAQNSMCSRTEPGQQRCVTLTSHSEK